MEEITRQFTCKNETDMTLANNSWNLKEWVMVSSVTEPGLMWGAHTEGQISLFN